MNVIEAELFIRKQAHRLNREDILKRRCAHLNFKNKSTPLPLPVASFATIHPKIS